MTTLIDIKKEPATFLREVGLSNKIQKAVIKHNEVEGNRRITMSDYINAAVNEKLIKDKIFK